jgi:hypothetical protein
VGAEQTRHGSAGELEAGDREEPHDRQRAQRLELAVSVRVILVGCLGRYAHHDHRQHIVERVDRRVQGIAQHGERARREPHRDLGDYDGQVGEE